MSAKADMSGRCRQLADRPSMSTCSSIASSYGSHPKLHLNLTAPTTLEDGCTQHILLTLPPHIFIDKFEFPFEHTMWGHADLELPVHALEDSNPTYVLLNVAEESMRREDSRISPVHLELPLHLRYAEARNGGEYERTTMDYPLVFTVCPAPHGSSEPCTSFQPPATRAHTDLAYSSAQLQSIPPPFHSPFDERQNSITIIPRRAQNGAHHHEFFIPVGNTDHLPFVQFGTAVLVFLCFIQVGSTLLSAYTRIQQGTTSGIREKRE